MITATYFSLEPRGDSGSCRSRPQQQVEQVKTPGPGIMHIFINYNS